MKLKKALLVLPLSLLLFACSKNTTTTKSTTSKTDKTTQVTTSRKTTTEKVTTVDNKIKVTFMDDKGVILKTEKIEKGTTVDPLDVDEVEGKEFLGWYYNGSAWTFTNTIDDDMTLVGKWESKKYSFKVECDMIDYDYDTQITFGLEVKLKAKSIEFYEFKGWYDGGTELSTSENYTFNMPAKNLTIEAKYAPMGDIDKLEYTVENGVYTITGVKDGAVFNSVLVIPEGIQVMGDSCLFSAMDEHFTLLILPDSLTEIAEDAFLGPYIDNLVVGKNLRSIGDYAFDGTGISIIYYKGNKTDWNKVSVGKGITVRVFYYSEDGSEIDDVYWYFDENGMPQVWVGDDGD